MSELSGSTMTLWMVFSLSFMVALTGALAPGPLLTYTIIRTAKSGKYGYLMGLWIIVGHAILEMGVVLFLLLGFSVILKDIIIIRIIGGLGGMVMIAFGASIIWDIYRGKTSVDFMKPELGEGKNTRINPHKPLSQKQLMDNPILGGFVISMANPYWWVWWATIGLAFMIQYDVSLQAWPKLIAFFLGHEAGDLIWYLIVSILTFFGLRYINKRIYYGVLGFCALFMILFGLYLGISPFLQMSV